MDDFYKLSAKMKDLFPSDPAADKQALLQMANAPAPDAPQTKDYITESVQVPQGSMPLGIDNVSDFAKLAGITESQKTGSAGQAKGSDPMPTAEPKRTTHPLKDKLVGEEDIDVRALTPAASTVGGAIDPEMDESALIAIGLKKAASGEILSERERDVIKPYVALFSELITNPMFRSQIISMQKTLSKIQKKDGVEEGDGRKKGIHGKGHPMRKKQQAAIHANESSSNLEQDLIDMYKGDGEAGLAMYMVDYLKFTEKEVSQAFKKAGGDIYKMISNVASMKNEGDLIPNPKSSTLAKSDTAYDFIKLGTHLANTDTMDPDDVNPSEPDVMIVPFSPEEDEIIKVALKKMGYKTQDAGGNKDAHYDENFADGKKPGRKGLAKRSGVDTKASVSSLRKTAKGSSGEKQRMAHWMANMKAGKAKAK